MDTTNHKHENIAPTITCSKHIQCADRACEFVGRTAQRVINSVIRGSHVAVVRLEKRLQLGSQERRVHSSRVVIVVVAVVIVIAAVAVAVVVVVAVTVAVAVAADE
eukprot:2299824-Amphidinium_carterae.3